MWTTATSEVKQPTDYLLRRVIVDLSSAQIHQEVVACQDLDDFLGGIARSFKLLAHYQVQDAFAPTSPLIMNLGVFSGTDLMTGLRIFFSAYSPLKVANNGRPLAMWSCASDKFGTKLLAAGVDEVIFLGRAQSPVYLLVQRNDTTGLTFSVQDASDLCGQTTHAKIMQLAHRHPDSHVAAIGPAGEHWQQNFYGAIACSTVNQLRSADCKPRFAGRGGMGSIMGSKNLIAIVAQAPDIILVFDGKTDMEYWVDAITNPTRGIYYTRDDMLGLCKFAGAPDKVIEPVFKELYGIEVTREELVRAAERTYLRGFLLERKQGTTLDDYVLPARVYEQNPHVQLPHFITPEFWQELRQRVFQAFEAQVEHYGLQRAAG